MKWSETAIKNIEKQKRACKQSMSKLLLTKRIIYEQQYLMIIRLLLSYNYGEETGLIIMLSLYRFITSLHNISLYYETHILLFQENIFISC